jgi:UDP-N-acetylmuramyl pentapeptide phosphotransferase/UDP-N-acetylglucosamine-1-phosphate transferase
MKGCAEPRSIICNSSHELLLPSKELGVTLLGLAGFVFLLAWLGTSCLCWRTSKVFLLDHPNVRSLHTVATPRAGGVAIIGSLFLGLIAARVLGLLAMREGLSWSGWVHLESWILGMTILLGLVSFLDDRGGVPVWLRLGCQFAASGILALGASLVLSAIQLPLLGTIELGWLGVPLTVLFLVWFTNLYNFMDGMDGFAGGMTVFGCGFMAYFAWKAGHEFILVSALLLSVASAGFLMYNFPPAKIFMGDVGSVSSGFLCGVLIILGCRDRVFDFWVPFILFSPFILDATATLVGRVWQREKIWVAHRTHYYQRLVLSGWGHRKAVLAEYAVMALCGGFALLYQYASEEWRLVILGFWGVLFLSLALAVKGVEQRRQPVGS